MCDALSASGYAYIAYTAWSHRDPEKVHTGTRWKAPSTGWDSFRVIVPYSRELAPHEHAVVVAQYESLPAAGKAAWLRERAEKMLAEAKRLEADVSR